MRGAMYTSESVNYLLIYCQHPDVSVGLHPELRAFARHVAHAVYSVHGTKGISIYEVPTSKSSIIESRVSLSRTCGIPKQELKDQPAIFTEHGIGLSVLAGADAPSLERIVALDVRTFAGNKIPAKRGQPYTRLVDSVVQTPAVKEGGGEVKIETTGKQDFIPACLADINIELTNQSCVATLYQRYFSPYSSCTYCYDRRKHLYDPRKTVCKPDVQAIAEKIRQARADREKDKRGLPTEFIRFGKYSEAGSTITRETLLAALEACIDEKVKPIFPTKCLEFDPEVARLFIRSGGAQLFSLGPNQYEEGLSSSGFDNHFRIEQAIRYKEAGANSGLYVLIEASNYDNPFHDYLALALEAHQQHGIPLQLLPLRPNGEKQLEQFTGHSKATIVRCRDPLLIDFPDKPLNYGAYQKAGNNQYLVEKMDPRFLQLLADKTAKMCHHNSKQVWCGHCLHKCSRPVPQIVYTARELQQAGTYTRYGQQDPNDPRGKRSKSRRPNMPRTPPPSLWR